MAETDFDASDWSTNDSRLMTELEDQDEKKPGRKFRICFKNDKFCKGNE